MSFMFFIKSLSNIILFFRQTLLLLNNGLSLQQTLTALKSQSVSFKHYVHSVEIDHHAGSNVITCFHNIVLTKGFLGCSFKGSLPDLKLWLKTYIDFLSSLKEQLLCLMKKLLYPLVMVCSIFILGLFLFFFFIPKIISQYKLYGITLPLILQYCDLLLGYFSDYFITILLFLVLIFYVIKLLSLDSVLLFFMRPFFLLELYWSFFLLFSQGLDIKTVVNSISFSDKHPFFFEYERFKKDFFATASLAASFPVYFCDDPLFKVLIDHADKQLNYKSLFEDIITLYEQSFFTKLTIIISIVQPILLLFVAVTIMLIFMLCFSPMLYMLENML